MQTTAEAREELLDRLGRAIEAIGFALTSLGSAYEQLDQFKADELEEKLFQPAQRAFGRAKRIHTEFATRHGVTSRKLESSSAGLPSIGAKAFIENAVTAVGRADVALSELQDSLLPVEVGDPELRAGLAELRELLAGFDERARELVRTLGR
jgi:hypothetical protein